MIVGVAALEVEPFRDEDEEDPVLVALALVDTGPPPGAVLVAGPGVVPG